MAKKWALPLWERLLEAHGTKVSIEDMDSSPLAHPFILTLAKLEALALYIFESKMTAIRRKLLLSDTDLLAPTSNVKAAIACAISYQTVFTQGTWEESAEESHKLKQHIAEIESQLSHAGPNMPLAVIADKMFKISMYRPLSHLSGFEQIEQWPISQLSDEFKAVIGLQVSEAILQKRLADSVPDIAPISTQNKHVASFYTTHIFPSWRNVSRELWPTSLKSSMELYYGIPWDGIPDDPAEQHSVVPVLMFVCSEYLLQGVDQAKK
jgi:hypothetical protein